MEIYTKEQLVSAMTKYHEEVKKHPEDFKDKEDLTNEEKGLSCINYLLSLVDLQEA